MPNPTTHILISIILIELFRGFFVKNNKNFPRYYILVAAIAGILPDLDFLVYYALFPFGYSIQEIHRTYLSSIFFPLIFLLIGFLILKTGIKISWIGKRHIKLSWVFFILSAGSFLHIFLDGIFSGFVMPLYPLDSLKIGLNLVSFFPEQIQWSISHLIDVLLLLFWLFWMEFKLKISDYF